MAIGDIAVLSAWQEITPLVTGTRYVRVFPANGVDIYAFPCMQLTWPGPVSNLSMLTGRIDPVTGVYTHIALQWTDTWLQAWAGFCWWTANVGAFAYDGPGNDGWLQMIWVDNAGGIGMAYSGPYEFEPLGTTLDPYILKVSDTVAVVAYEGNWQANLRTIAMLADGTIVGNIALLVFAAGATSCHNPNIKHITGNIYAIAYQDSVANQDLIFTVSIDAAGNISAIISTLLIEAPAAGVWAECDIHCIAPGIYALAYTSPVTGATLITFPIDDAGNIGAIIATLGIDVNGYSISMCSIGGTWFAISYIRDWLADDWAWIATVEVLADGTIVGVADSNMYHTAGAFGQFSYIAHLKDEMYGIMNFTAARTYLSTFTFQSVMPAVTTDPATNITGQQGDLNGTLDDQGGINPCDCGFEWGETIAYGNTTPTQSRTTGQTFSQTIAGLSPGRAYHFRAFATNKYGTVYGADESFNTPAPGGSSIGAGVLLVLT